MIIKGEFFALFTAISWTFSSLTFGKISKEYDTQVANFLRVTIGTIMVGFVCLFGSRHLFLPTDVTWENLKIISLSGFIGMFLGDLFLFKAYNMIGARVTMLIMALSPIIVSIIDFLFLDVTLYPIQIFAILITCLGIILVIFKTEDKKISLGFSVKGLFYAFLATLGQSLGVILTKLGSTTYDSLATSQIRLGVAIFFFGAVVLYEGKARETIKMITSKKALSLLLIGTFFSVFGIAALIEAFKSANASIASTISSTSPIIMIPCSILFYKEKIRKNEIIGAIISVVGLSIFFL
ncbi:MULTISPECIES: DMT family transporter [Fusobacterium]|uniref:DMT family transporter n=1 Tax=Fusobacterium TaxID=848 RepID=UPI001F3B0780|nr:MULTISPECIES: DMT family transporter [Fusobacterium]MCF2613222.1 DMT family transporter [Fusobacterium perfoetens]MDY2981285.1 DMT family transporter [Fusobacterium sp.]